MSSYQGSDLYAFQSFGTQERPATLAVAKSALFAFIAMQFGSVFLSLDRLTAATIQQAAIGQAPVTVEWVVALVLFLSLLPLGLMYLVLRARSSKARWLLVLATGVGLMGMLPPTAWTHAASFGPPVFLMHIGGIVAQMLLIACLIAPPTSTWLHRRG